MGCRSNFATGRRAQLVPNLDWAIGGGFDTLFDWWRISEGSMRGYGQFCPVAKGAEVFAERWTPLVLRELLCGSTHFNDLHRGVPLMSRTLLSRRLRQLEEIGVVERKRGSPGPEYHLTQAGRDFAPIIERLGAWGQRWFRSQFSRDELDVSLLLWDMRRGVKPDAFPQGRISVQFDFSDLPASRRTWWLVCEGGEVDICPTDPGFEVSLWVATDVRTMSRVWMGDIPVKAAIRSGGIELDGSRELRQRFERWLGLSGFAGIQDGRLPSQHVPNDARPVQRQVSHRVT
jgi:DNA-binding HxlR family transcriptional regulator